MRYDRRVSEALLNAIEDEGPLAGLIDVVRADRGTRDLQLRRARGVECWATLYVGLTKVLDIKERNGQFRLDAHPTYTSLPEFDVTWRQWQDLADLQNTWYAVLTYVEAAIASVRAEFTNGEGAVQAALLSGAAEQFRTIDREVVLAHTNTASRNATLNPVEIALNEALGAANDGAPWWPGARSRVSFGGELDVLAIDEAGRLLTIEVKPANTVAGIAKSPAQVALYATLWSMWLDETDESEHVLQGMLDQRARLGLGRPGPAPTPESVVPVVAIGPGKLSKEALPRLRQVAQAVQPVLQARPSVQPLEVWLVDEQGCPVEKEILG
jgi:hypothetical protein